MGSRRSARVQHGANSALEIEVPACKECHIMAEPDEFFGQVGNDPLSAAIQTGRNALNEGSDLCDFHDDLYSPRRL